MKVTLSAIREHYQKMGTEFPLDNRRERVRVAVRFAQIEAREAEEYKYVLEEARARNEMYSDDEREGASEDDYEGELPW